MQNSSGLTLNFAKMKEKLLEKFKEKITISLVQNDPKVAAEANNPEITVHNPPKGPGFEFQTKEDSPSNILPASNPANKSPASNVNPNLPATVSPSMAASFHGFGIGGFPPMMGWPTSSWGWVPPNAYKSYHAMPAAAGIPAAAAGIPAPSGIPAAAAGIPAPSGIPASTGIPAAATGMPAIFGNTNFSPNTLNSTASQAPGPISSPAPSDKSVDISEYLRFCHVDPS
ncbi:hypothetical protein PTTG_10559, partial [Puccinia triticina 1-1 BBBD Race 1]